MSQINVGRICPGGRVGLLGGIWLAAAMLLPLLDKAILVVEPRP